MTWSHVPTVTAGLPVSKAAWFDVVSGDLNALGDAWTSDARLPGTPAAVWTTVGAAIGNGSLVSRYRLAGKTLDWLVLLTFGNTTNGGSGGQQVFAWPGGVTPLNVGYVGGQALLNDVSVPTKYLGAVEVASASAQLRCITSAAGATGSVTNAVPVTWATGDVFGFLLTGIEVV